MSTKVAFIGWNSSTRAWNTSTWNTSPAFTLTATGAIGQAVQEGDAVVSVTGLAGTSALGNIFSTNVGLGSTSSIGAISTTRGDNAFVTGVAGTTALGGFFTTNTMTDVKMTASVNSATAVTVSNANISVVGVTCTAVVGNLASPPWGQIIPDQNPNFLNIAPSQNPSWANIENGRVA